MVMKTMKNETLETVAEMNQKRIIFDMSVLHINAEKLTKVVDACINLKIKIYLPDVLIDHCHKIKSKRFLPESSIARKLLILSSQFPTSFLPVTIPADKGRFSGMELPKAHHNRSILKYATANKIALFTTKAIPLSRKLFLPVVFEEPETRPSLCTLGVVINVHNELVVPASLLKNESDSLYIQLVSTDGEIQTHENEPPYILKEGTHVLLFINNHGIFQFMDYQIRNLNANGHAELLEYHIFDFDGSNINGQIKKKGIKSAMHKQFLRNAYLHLVRDNGIETMAA